MSYYRHGHANEGRKSSEYHAWEAAKSRCNNLNDKGYHNYGGRGIKVCERWNDFSNFFADMGVRPPGLTLDREDNDGNYEPGNCRWVTRKEQQNNCRPKSCGPVKQYWFYGHGPNGEMIIENNQRYIAKKFGLSNGNISSCLNGKRKQCKGWQFQRLGGVLFQYTSTNVRSVDIYLKKRTIYICAYVITIALIVISGHELSD